MQFKAQFQMYYFVNSDLSYLWFAKEFENSFFEPIFALWKNLEHSDLAVSSKKAEIEN